MIQSVTFMIPRGKATVVLLGIVAALALTVAAIAITFQMRERDLRLAKERELLLVQAENHELLQQIREVRDAKQQLESQLAQVKEQFAQTMKQLTEERQANEQLVKTAGERQQQLEQMTKDLEHTRAERLSLTEQLAQLNAEREGLQQQLGELQRVKQQLKEQIVQLSEHPTVELDKVVVTKAPPPNPANVPSAPQAGQMSQPNPAASPEAVSSPVSSSHASPLEGQVIVVNREYDFIVMNLGSNQGLTVGQEFQIVRGEQVLGRAKVEKVYDDLSAAAILPESKKDAIREGDVVKAI